MRQIFRSINDGWQFFRENGLKTTITSKQAPWIIQFGKYGACGVLATVVHHGIVFLLSATWLPALDSMDLDDKVRSQNLILSNCIAFVVSNVVAYLSNLMVVFQGGRHSRWKEFAIFTGVNLISFVPALASGPWLTRFGLPTWAAQVIFTVTAALVNFVCRKFIVFKH